MEWLTVVLLIVNFDSADKIVFMHCSVRKITGGEQDCSLIGLMCLSKD